jgi:hypothetical protein
MGHLHVHPGNQREDFILLGPDPTIEDGDGKGGLRAYMHGERLRKYYFCKECGVRCFTIGGEWETIDIDLTQLGLDHNQLATFTSTGESKKQKAWRIKWDEQEESRPYVSINGVTIDFHQGFDLRVLTEEKRVQYFDGRSPVEEEKPARWNRPHYGGCY